MSIPNNKRTVPAPNKQGFFSVITTLTIQCNMYLHSIHIVLGIRRNPDMTERTQKGAGMLCAKFLSSFYKGLQHLQDLVLRKWGTLEPSSMDAGVDYTS